MKHESSDPLFDMLDSTQLNKIKTQLNIVCRCLLYTIVPLLLLYLLNILVLVEWHARDYHQPTPTTTNTMGFNFSMANLYQHISTQNDIISLINTMDLSTSIKQKLVV